MKLSEYLAAEKMSNAAFAAKIGVGRHAVHRYLSGDRRPDWPVLAKIAEVTQNRVTADDFMPAAEVHP